MKLFSPSIILLSTLLLASCASNSKAESAKSFSAESRAELAAYELPRTTIAPIKDSKKDRQYELYIKLPEEYSENTDVKYPVIYTTDASVHMEMLYGATEFLMPNVILVGISYQKDLVGKPPFVSRFRDYEITEYSNPEAQARMQGGQVSHYLDFIRNEVIPYVDTKYRTIPNERSYFGYSLGGAFGAYTLFAQPDTFKNYILGSPAFRQTSLKYIDEFEEKTALGQEEMNVNVFVSLGELEEKSAESVDHFMSVLRRRSEVGLTLTGLEIIKDSDHGSAFPETVIRSIKWLSQQDE